MKKMMKCLVLAMAVLAIAGSAWCWDFADHVKIAPNGQGDMLLYPFYAAVNGGWETRVSVVNTSPNRSVVAHIVFYTAKNSLELTDFFVFLTPTDVWYGIVKIGADGKAYIWSDDDSAMNDAGAFATAAAPMNHPFRNPVAEAGTCTKGDPEPWLKSGVQIGYMKIIELAHSSASVGNTFVPGGAYGTQTFNLNKPKVDKNVLKAAFDAFMDLSDGSSVKATTTNPMIMDGINVIKGSMEFRNSLTGQGAIIPSTTLRDYDNQLPVGYTQSIGFAAGCGYSGGYGVTGAAPTLVQDLSGISGALAGCQVGGGPASKSVICNPGGKTVTQTGCGCLTGGIACESNSVGEVEAALAKDWLEMPILGKANTVHILTFPTKQTGTGQAAGVTDCYFVSTPSPFFNEVSGAITRTIWPPTSRPTTYSSSWETWGCVQYLSSDYDLSENASSTSGIFSPSAISQALCAEVNLRVGDFAFENGWSVYNFTTVGSGTSTVGKSTYTTRFNMQANLSATVGGYDAQYTGAPVIATALYMGESGLKLAPSSWVDGEVRSLGANGVIDSSSTTTDDVVYNYYQYWDSLNTNGMPAAGELNSTVQYSEDATGCCVNNATPPAVVPCGTVLSAGPPIVYATQVPCGISLAYGGGTYNIYGNKFSGNRPGVLANVAIAATKKAMTVFVPKGAVITATPVAPAVLAVTGAPYTLVPTNGVATTEDTMITIPAGTAIVSSVDLLSPDPNVPSTAAAPQPSQMPW